MYQLAVIGAGPGGYEAAIRAAQLGLRVALIEKDALGGTCLNRGCIPTKALLHTAEVYRAAKEGAALGVCAREVTLDERAMFARKEEVVRGLRAGIAQLVRANRIDLYEGEGRIEAAGRVAVGGSTVEAERILVATGSVPRCRRSRGSTCASPATICWTAATCRSAWRSSAAASSAWSSPRC